VPQQANRHLALEFFVVKNQKKKRLDCAPRGLRQ
jgi:hypothetical protein